IPEELPNTLVASTNDTKDLADAEQAGPNILEDSDDDADQPAEPVRTVIGPPPPKPIVAVTTPPPPPLPRVPDFTGKTLRAVLAEASAKGLTVMPNGSGVARVQSPPAGAVLHEGERIRVVFER